jgi:hypothetical protein
MRPNPFFEKSVRLLAHPGSLAALGIYALNTFVLQRLFPGWLTGKLGDFAWLYFAPFALAALFALILPVKWKGGAFSLAVAVVGLTFALVKMTVVNEWLTATLQAALRMPVAVARDPGDGIALLSLLGSLWTWKYSHPVGILSRKVGLAVLPVIALLTLADSAMPDYGIIYMEVKEDALLACSSRGVFESRDGGLTWELGSFDSLNCYQMSPENTVVSDPGNEDILYRYAPNRIERSTDKGETWALDYEMAPASEAERIYLEAHQSVSFYGDLDPPFYALADPVSGNILFAMGRDGVLVRRAGEVAAYTWVSVDLYHRVEIDRLELIGMVGGELCMALIAGGLVITLASLFIRKSVVKTIFLVVALIGWSLMYLLFPPTLSAASPYSAAAPALGIPLLGLLTLALFVESLIRIGMAAKPLLLRFLLALAGTAILFYLPFLFWALNLIQDYHLADLIANLLFIGSMITMSITTIKWVRAHRP